LQANEDKTAGKNGSLLCVRIKFCNHQTAWENQGVKIAPTPTSTLFSKGALPADTHTHTEKIKIVVNLSFTLVSIPSVKDDSLWALGLSMVPKLNLKCEIFYIFTGNPLICDCEMRWYKKWINGEWQVVVLVIEVHSLL
jgi:hypothetical protein